MKKTFKDLLSIKYVYIKQVKFLPARNFGCTKQNKIKILLKKLSKKPRVIFLYFASNSIYNVDNLCTI